MLNRLPQSSGLRKKQTTVKSYPSFQIEQKLSEQKIQVIPSLITKFVNLSSQIEIQHNISSFNLIQYDNQDTILKFDENIANAKLKRIQNNAELKRANMQLFMRKRRIQKIKQQKQKQQFKQQTKQDQNNNKNQYQNIFKTFAENNNNKKLDQQNDSIQQQQIPQKIIQNFAPNQDGILYINQLKKHPKLLNYTLQKVKAKKIQIQRQKYKKRDRIIKFRNELRTYTYSQPRIINKQKQILQYNKYQPQQIFENIFRRIYTKQNHNRSISQAKNDIRLNKFINKQQQILSNVNQRSLSKQNYKKLKQKLDHLLNQLYKVDKKYTIQRKNQYFMNKTIDMFHQNS